MNGAPDVAAASQASGADVAAGGIVRSQFKRQLPQVSWVASGQASVSVPCDDTYKRVFFYFSHSFSVN